VGTKKKGGRRAHDGVDGGPPPRAPRRFPTFSDSARRLIRAWPDAPGDRPYDDAHSSSPSYRQRSRDEAIFFRPGIRHGRECACCLHSRPAATPSTIEALGAAAARGCAPWRGGDMNGRPGGVLATRGPRCVPPRSEHIPGSRRPQGERVTTCSASWGSWRIGISVDPPMTRGGAGPREIAHALLRGATAAMAMPSMPAFTFDWESRRANRRPGNPEAGASKPLLRKIPRSRPARCI